LFILTKQLWYKNGKRSFHGDTLQSWNSTGITTNWSRVIIVKNLDVFNVFKLRINAYNVNNDPYIQRRFF
jgi:hypothetical protein